MLVCSVIFQFLAAFLSFRFVLHRRLGTPWLLVSASLLIVGGLRINSLVLYYEEPDPASFSTAMVRWPGGRAPGRDKGSSRRSRCAGTIPRQEVALPGWRSARGRSAW